MRVVLISPKGPLYRHRGGIFGQALRYKPLTLPTLAALVPPDLGISVTCLDEGIQDVDPERIDADLVGMTVITGSALRAYELSAAFRRRGIPVVLGGPHVTLVPDDAAPHADTIVTGYAEQTWPQLLRDFQAGVMQPRYQQPADFTLADSPFPRREVLPTRSYLTEHVFEATRGCVHDCEFCVVPSAWGRRPWQKPVAHVVEDIRRMGSKRLIFVDLNLIADKAYARELFTALAPLRVEWFGLSTTLLCDDLPLLDLAAKSGCRGLLMGLESINPRSLRSSGKGFNHPEQFAQAVERLHERRIALQGCFVFGLDEDTSGVFEATAQFALDAKIDLPRFAIVTPFPGTALYRRHEQEGRLLHRDWSKYDGQHCVFQPRHLTPRELEQGTERAWKRVYSWSGIWQRLRHTAAPWPIALGTNLGYRFYAQRLHRFYQCDAGFAVPARPVLPALGTFAPTPVTVNAGEVAPPSP